MATGRWRFDSWLFLRDGSPAGLGAARPAFYGASQIGGVLTYRLSERSALYLRASQALVDRGEKEVAAGTSFRPIGAFPVTANLEVRATDRPGGSELRPAAFIAGGFEGQTLSAGFETRGYGQAGFVGGEFATAFADGSVHVERPIANFPFGEVHLGAGGWGGMQEGASRLDGGPTVRLDLDVAKVPVRIAVDYRIRLAGDAEPASGPAMTISTGF